MVDFLSFPPTHLLQLLDVCCASYEVWKPLNSSNPFIVEIWADVQHPSEVNQTPFLDYIIREVWLYKLN